MRKILSVLLSVAMIAALAGCGAKTDNTAAIQQPAADPLATQYPLTITIYDSQGEAHEETFEKAPEKVVTVTTSSAEILTALGLADKIVGTIKPDNAVPDELKETFDSFNILGDKKTLSQETIVAADPDIVIGRASSFKDNTSIESYADLGILCYPAVTGNAKADPELSALFTDIRNIGKIFDISQTAENYASELEARLESALKIAEEKKGDKPARSMFMVALKDGTFGVMGGPLQNKIMESLGCEVVAESGQSGLGYENLIAYNPDFIVYISADRNAATDEIALNTLCSEPVLQGVPAIANKNICFIKYDDIMDVGPRLIGAVEQLTAFLYQ